jgi:hypothetical protein
MAKGGERGEACKDVRIKKAIRFVNKQSNPVQAYIIGIKRLWTRKWLKLQN